MADTRAKRPRLLVFELNEFNPELLEAGIAEMGLRNVERMLRLPKHETFTEDLPESDLLDPWVQWVSVHTGQPAKIHKIGHMADVTGLKHPLLWEVLNREGVTTGILGPMNAAPSGHEKELFFYPDPWTFTASAHPKELSTMLEFPRYAATHYLSPSPTRLATDFLKFLSCFTSKAVIAPAARNVLELIPRFARFRGGHFVAASFLDRMAALKFVELRDRYDPEFSLFFANLVAHAQHHHWSETDLRKNPKLQLVLRDLDWIAGLLLSSLRKDESIVVLNGMSQENINSRKPWILYRQKDQEAFLRRVGIRFESVHSHMTYDAHVFFESEEDCAAAKRLLDTGRIQGHRLFITERYPADPRKLFYQVHFTDELPELEKVSFTLNGQPMPFAESFEKVVRRTGTHTQTGSVYTNVPAWPARMPNHEFFDRVLEFYGLQARRAAADLHAGSSL